jgi:DNA-binding SARP family transcriptional activator/DNA-binding XRE family transcriptional regulator
MTMGLLIRQCRRAADLTQRQLAEAAGVSVAAVRDLEQGRTACPRWGTVENLAGVLGLSSRQRAELLRAWRQPGQRGPRPDVRIDVLGPLVATRFGRPVALGSVRQRAVLGLLVLHQDTWVHRDAIIELLWGERPPPSAVAEVLGYVNRLRGQLDPMRDRGERAGLISSGGRCYRFRADEASVDLAIFWRYARRADEAARCDPARGCELYEQALALWRDDALADVDLMWQHPAVTALGCRRAELVLGFAGAAAAVGAQARALPHLRRLCDRDPLNERAHAHLILALAAVGEQAAALDVFTSLRRRLDADLGVRPSKVLAQAHLSVLRQQVS